MVRESLSLFGSNRRSHQGVYRGSTGGLQGGLQGVYRGATRVHRGSTGGLQGVTQKSSEPRPTFHFCSFGSTSTRLLDNNDGVKVKKECHAPRPPPPALQAWLAQQAP
eukprot:76489-Prorocentrum_minimum.AAC.2